MSRWPYIFVIVVLGATTLAACATATATETTLPSAPLPTTVAPPTATPTPLPNRLVLCGGEPAAISPFVPSSPGDDLLALYFEPPIEPVNYRWEPRLVTHVPSLESGDVVTEIVPVLTGERYVDPTGAVIVHPGPATLMLPQLSVTFALRGDARWSDGDPISTEDVLLGYHLAQSTMARGPWQALVERTEKLTALDELRVQWVGIPGFINTDYPGFLFPPQPAHRWRGQTLSQILQDRTPLATGPYQIMSWEAGREVRLEPNPHYLGEAPHFDEVVFRFLPAMNDMAEMLMTGACDVLLPDPVMNSDWRTWNAIAGQGEASIWADVAPIVLRLDFNLAPRDDGPALLADPQVRRAIAHCLDRDNLSAALPGTALIAANGFIPLGHPAYSATAGQQIPYDPEIGRALLDEAGWRDVDGDGLREAHGIGGVAERTPLSLTLHLAPQYFLSAAHISANLEECGVGIAPLPTEAQLLYAADPVSPLFGRTFDLALFGWEADIPLVCGAWYSDRIPDAENAWTGENFSGYASERYDAACLRAMQTVDPEEQIAALREAQAELVSDLPTLFLVWRPYWMVARPAVQGLQPDASASGAVWNVEDIQIQEP